MFPFLNLKWSNFQIENYPASFSILSNAL